MAQMETLAVRTTATERATLEALAKNSGQSMGAVIRAWLRSQAEQVQQQTE